MNTPTTGPKCPNHGATLEGIPFPMPSKGKGICPISGVPFDYEVDSTELSEAVDKDGNKTTSKQWKLTGEENI